VCLVHRPCAIAILESVDTHRATRARTDDVTLVVVKSLGD
jgi:hypothetical protein